MKPLNQITCMVVDLGLFVELARVLGRAFKKVYYCNPSWPTPFPKINQAYIGQGFDEIEVCLSPMEHFKEIDLYVFPDVGHGELQIHLEALGKWVWGCRRAELLEFDRQYMKNLMKKVGLPVNQWETIKGIKALREHLKSHKDQWVKVNKWRGLFESFNSPNYKLLEPRLDEIEWQLGAFKNILDFIVENDLPERFEVAIDAYNIDGQMPAQTLYGCEIKDLGYIGKFTDYSKIPKPLREFDEKMAPTLKDYRFRSFYSPEHRVGKDKIAYMIDLCARSPSPPNELYQVFYENLPEIIARGAQGECVDPDPASVWGAEILIHSPWATKNWQPVEYPREYSSFVKLRNAVRIGGKTYTMPQAADLPEIGSVVGYGENMQEAIEMAMEVADSVKGYYLEIPTDSLEKAKEEIDRAKEFGVWVE